MGNWSKVINKRTRSSLDVLLNRTKCRSTRPPKLFKVPWSHYHPTLDSICWGKDSIFRTFSPRPLLSFTFGHNFVKILMMLVQWSQLKINKGCKVLIIWIKHCIILVVQLLTSIFNCPPTNPPCTVQRSAKSTLARPSSPSTNVTLHSFFSGCTHVQVEEI